MRYETRQIETLRNLGQQLGALRRAPTIETQTGQCVPYNLGFDPSGWLREKPLGAERGSLEGTLLNQS